MRGAVISLLVLVAGVLVFMLAHDAKIVWLGEIAVFCGLLASLFHADRLTRA